MRRQRVESMIKKKYRRKNFTIITQISQTNGKFVVSTSPMHAPAAPSAVSDPHAPFIVPLGLTLAKEIGVAR